MDSFDQNRSPGACNIVQKASGFVLLIIGITIGCWVVFVIFNLIGNSDKLGIIEVFANELDRTIRTPSGDFQLPVGSYVAAGYLVVIFLLSICANIAKSFVQFAAHLIQSDLKALVTKLTKEFKIALKNERQSD